LPASSACASFAPDPQLLRNGQDWRDYARALDSTSPAKANIVMQRTQGADSFKATVTPASGVENWSAYWTVTEHGHSSRVKVGENSGEFLKHDSWCANTPR
jgi:hypothetical protein